MKNLLSVVCAQTYSTHRPNTPTLLRLFFWSYHEGCRRGQLWEVVRRKTSYILSGSVGDRVGGGGIALLLLAE
jgi:hypothetical protein